MTLFKNHIFIFIFFILLLYMKCHVDVRLEHLLNLGHLKPLFNHFVSFCFRDDIAGQLESIEEPWMLAIDLFEEETDNDIRPQTMFIQLGNKNHRIVNIYFCSFLFNFAHRF